MTRVPPSSPAAPDRPAAVPEVTLAAAIAGHLTAPLEPLRSHFRSSWSRLPTATDLRPIAVVPDGGVDLCWRDGHLSVDGPHRSLTTEPPTPGSPVVGVSFLPGAAPRWLGVPASALADRSLPLAELWGADARRLADHLGEATTPTAIANRLEHALLSRAATIDPIDEETRRLFALIASTPTTAALVDRLGLAERTLRRRCHHAFGHGPTTLRRILRFHRFLRHASHPTAAQTIARRALATGYADQAHLCRESRRLAGLSPRQVVAQLGQPCQPRR